MTHIKPGKYKHFRNLKTYEVIGITYNADNDCVDTDPLNRPYVLYKTETGQLWVRPLAQFTEIPEGESKARFEFITDQE